MSYVLDMHMYIYIYIYIEREIERERDVIGAGCRHGRRGADQREGRNKENENTRT